MASSVIKQDGDYLLSWIKLRGRYWNKIKQQDNEQWGHLHRSESSTRLKTLIWGPERSFQTTLLLLMGVREIFDTSWALNVTMDPSLGLWPKCFISWAKQRFGLFPIGSMIDPFSKGVYLWISNAWCLNTKAVNFIGFGDCGGTYPLITPMWTLQLFLLFISSCLFQLSFPFVSVLS